MPIWTFGDLFRKMANSAYILTVFLIFPLFILRSAHFKIIVVLDLELYHYLLSYKQMKQIHEIVRLQTSNWQNQAKFRPPQ